MRRVEKTIFCLIFVLAASFATFGQFGSGIQGTVTDQGGAVVPGAKVSLTNVGTNITVETVTNDSGFYFFNSLVQGNYRLIVSLTGFKKKIVNNLVLGAEKLAGVDVSLETGSITAEVTVEGTEGVTLETEDANVGRNITNREVLQLPQVGRNPYELARLAPGVFGDGARAAGGGAARIGNNGSGPGGASNGIFAVENQTQISANGQRVTSNNYEVDGVSVNSQTWGGTAIITPTQEIVDEVQVTSSTYSAEDGRNSGAQVKVITKYGTNNWHGSAFFKINDPSLNAYNSFRGVAGVAGLTNLAPQRVNDKFKTYGGSFGGPIFRDKLFFFTAYEGLTNNTRGVTGSTYVETAAFRQAMLGLRGNTLSGAFFQNGAAPRVAQVLAPSCALLNSVYLAAGRCQVVGDGVDIGSIFGTYGTYVPTANDVNGAGLDGVADLQLVTLETASRFRGNQSATRIDYQVTSRDKLTFTANFTPMKSFTYNTPAQSRPQADFNSDRITYALAGIYRHDISSMMVNEFRFNYTGWGFDEIKSNPNTEFGLPRIEIEAVYGDRLRFGAPRADTTPADFKQTQMDIRDVLSYVTGNHTLKFGVEYRRESNKSSSPGGARPLYSFTRMWNFANGTPVFQAINADATGTPRANSVPFNTSNVGAFIQDNWKFRSNLTLNMGLRWEYLAPISAGGDGNFGRLQLGTNGLIDAKIVTVKQFTKRDLTNFGPQLGFAWSPKFLKDKGVIRGGFGMGYDRLASALFSNVRFAPPNAARYSICCGSAANNGNTGATTGTIQFVRSTDNTIYNYPRNPTIGGGFGPNGGPVFGSVEIYSSPEDLPSAYVYRYSLEAQYEIGWKTVATLGYQGSAGRHFVRILPLHLILARQASSTFRTVYFASPDVNSNYNGLNASLRKRFSNSFDFNAKYSFSKSLDTVSLEAPCACTNQTYPYDNSTEKGPSDFDVTHFFVMTGTWEPSWFKGQKNVGGDLLADWSFSPVVTWRGGFPWTPTVGQSIGLSTDTATVGVIRPRVYYGTAPQNNSNETFTTTGMFPGNIITGANCGTAAAGCSNYFLTTRNGTSYIGNEPGIGRNTFRGPRYFSIDLSIAKAVRIPASGFFGEKARLDLRFNFFNLLNNLNLAPFNAQSNSTRADNVQFGYATGALAGRVGEFQARFSF